MGLRVKQGGVWDTAMDGASGAVGPAGLFTGAETLVMLGSVSGAVNVDLSAASAFSMSLTGNTTVTFANAQAGKVSYATLRVTQGAGGGFTLAVVGAQGSFGVQPLLSAAAGAVDKIACESWDSGAHWDVSLAGQSIS